MFIKRFVHKTIHLVNSLSIEFRILKILLFPKQNFSNFCYYLGVQRTEQQMDQIFEEMGNMRIQFQDMKKQMEDVKGQLEDTKIQLNETKIQLKESKIQLDESKVQLDESKIMTPLRKLIKYVKNPCWNCNGPVNEKETYDDTDFSFFTIVTKQA